MEIPNYLIEINWTIRTLSLFETCAISLFNSILTGLPATFPLASSPSRHSYKMSEEDLVPCTSRWWAVETAQPGSPFWTYSALPQWLLPSVPIELALN